MYLVNFDEDFMTSKCNCDMFLLQVTFLSFSALYIGVCNHFNCMSLYYHIQFAFLHVEDRSAKAIQSFCFLI